MMRVKWLERNGIENEHQSSTDMIHNRCADPLCFNWIFSGTQCTLLLTQNQCHGKVGWLVGFFF